MLNKIPFQNKSHQRSVWSQDQTPFMSARLSLLSWFPTSLFSVSFFWSESVLMVLRCSRSEWVLKRILSGPWHQGVEDPAKVVSEVKSQVGPDVIQVSGALRCHQDRDTRENCQGGEEVRTSVLMDMTQAWLPAPSQEQALDLSENNLTGVCWIECCKFKVLWEYLQSNNPTDVW